MDIEIEESHKSKDKVYTFLNGHLDRGAAALRVVTAKVPKWNFWKASPRREEAKRKKASEECGKER